MVKNHFVIMALLGSVTQATKLSYRPPTQESAPWHKPDIGSKAKEEEQYFVPNFGVDHDIISTQNHLK